MFFKFHEDMRKIFNEDIDKHNILTWIIYNTNYQEKYNELKIYQCYIAQRTISDITGIPQSKVCKKLKELEEEGYITYIFKSKSKHTSSIIYADFIAKNSQKSESVNESVNESVSESVELVENTALQGYCESVNESVNESVELVENTALQGYCESVNESVNESVSESLSRNISRNISNIYTSNDTSFDELCDELWKRYPNKKGKKVAYQKIKRLLKQYKLDELKRCVDRYSEDVSGREKQYIQHGDKFFNNGYVDYLDENYEVKENNVVPFKGKEL